MIDKINWKKINGLIPCIVQSTKSKEILMLGYMNKESLGKTLDNKKLCFYSRSKKRLWTKGESSENYLFLKDLQLDCDGDTLIAMVDEAGPCCHLNKPTCFNQSSLSFLESLENIIDSRRGACDSYSDSLFRRGIERISQKFGEESIELVIASTLKDKEEIIEEGADLIFHLQILLRAHNLSLKDISHKLEQRHYSR